MAFNFFLPKNELLKEFIAYYYSDGSDDEAYKNSYLFYPHVNTTISIYKNASWNFDKFSSKISFDEKTKYLKLVTHQTQPISSIQTGKTNKIAIVFRPLGLNRFIDRNYSEIVKNDAQYFQSFNDAEWEEMLDEIFTKNANDEKVEILDNFLLRQYNGYKNDVLEKSIAILSDVNNELSIDEIANSLKISRKTLLRYFKSELRISPELFRMIIRFRFAVNEKIVKDSNETLTQIAYEANFFDQAYFIKRFKKLTGVTPRKFFSEGTRIGKEDTFWTFDVKK